jgi:hypothetical protein
MTPLQSAHSGEATTSMVHIRERLEARLSALAEAMTQRNSEAIERAVAQIRNEAADQLAEQCKLLAGLSMTVATAEARRERRLSDLERELREIEQAAPKPLPIPRGREGKSAPSSVADLWSGRKPGA